MVVIRPARASEARCLADLGFAAWAEAVDSWGEDVERLSANARRAYETFTRDHFDVIVVAELDGEAAGWGARENRNNYISDLWVEPRFQGRGIGSALLAFMEGEVEAAGYSDVTLDTHARNSRAIAFYKARGYRVTALSTEYSPSLDCDIEKVDLVKEIAPWTDDAN